MLFQVSIASLLLSAASVVGLAVPVSNHGSSNGRLVRKSVSYDGASLADDSASLDQFASSAEKILEKLEKDPDAAFDEEAKLLGIDELLEDEAPPGKSNGTNDTSNLWIRRHPPLESESNGTESESNSTNNPKATTDTCEYPWVGKPQLCPTMIRERAKCTAMSADIDRRKVTQDVKSCAALAARNAVEFFLFGRPGGECHGKCLRVETSTFLGCFGENCCPEGYKKDPCYDYFMLVPRDLESNVANTSSLFDEDNLPPELENLLK